jgi:SAM-dependent methyltransferase
MFYRHAVTPLDRLARRGDALLPPAHLRRYYYRTLDPDAYRRACRAARTELDISGLAPTHNVLDIGCGIGNLAIGLAGFLEGRYDGVDVNREAVEWCRGAITGRYPRFRFHHADVASTAYNPKGRGDAARFRYPFDDRSFDRIFLGSVLTHLLPGAFEGTIAEIARLLSPHGRCIASCFLITDDNRPGVEAGRSFMSFGVAIDHARVHDAGCPEAAIAFDEPFVRDVIGRAGLAIENVRRGAWWSGASDDQDVLTLRATD